MLGVVNGFGYSIILSILKISVRHAAVSGLFWK